jgi:hypothetical protein
VQHVYVGQIDAPVSGLAVSEGQALAYFASDEIGELPVAYGFGALLAEYFAADEGNNGTDYRANET